MSRMAMRYGSIARRQRKSRYFVLAITARKTIIGYGIYDDVGGIEVEHVRFNVTTATTWEMARKQADDACKQMNKEIV